MTTALLAEWDNFYVITGSSAAGLTGLTFVVIALSADAKRVNVSGLRTYVTPTIVHFGAVLALAAYLSMPHQGALSLSSGARGLDLERDPAGDRLRRSHRLRVSALATSRLEHVRHRRRVDAADVHRHPQCVGRRGVWNSVRKQTQSK
jgi:hypothetical protein